MSDRQILGFVALALIVLAALLCFFGGYALHDHRRLGWALVACGCFTAAGADLAIHFLVFAR